MEPRTCDVCGDPFVAVRENARFCSARCRKRHSRNPDDVVPTVIRAAPLVEGEVSSIEEATRAQLEAVDRARSPLGQIALLLARRLDENRRESGMGVAAVVREHSRVLADAVRGASAAADPVDQLRVRRDRKRAG
jgi:hypothetical protein